MSIRFACACGRSFTVPADRAGKWTRCSGCQAKMQVPDAAPDAGFEVIDEPPAAPAGAIAFKCGCGQPLEVDAEFAGQDVECPTCKKVVRTPAAGPTRAKRVEKPQAVEVVDDDEPERPRKKKKRTDEERDSMRYFEPEHKTERFGTEKRILRGGVGAGIVAMVIAVVWFGLGLAAGRIFFYPPILFVIGAIGCIRSLMAGDD